MVSRLLAVIATLALALGVAAQGALGAGWTTPEGLSVAGGNATGPQVAVDSSGVVTAVWYRSNGSNDIIQASRFSGGSWQSPVDLSASGQNASGPQLAVDSSGVVTAVWYRYDGSNNPIIQASRFSGGSWSSPVNLSASGQNAYAPQVAVDSSGVVTAVWFRSNGSNTLIQASRFSGGSWSSPVNLSASGQNAFYPHLAVDSSGVVTAVWYRSNGSNDIIQASRFSGGSWSSSPVNLSASGQNAYFPQLAVDSSGVVTAVWYRSNGSNTVIQASRFSGGSWSSSPVNLSASGQSAFYPHLAVDSSGVVTAVWYRSNGSNTVIQASRFSGGSWSSSPVNLSAVGQNAHFPQLAVDSSGVVTAVWRRSNGSINITQASRFSDGSWQSPVDLSASGQSVFGEPQVAVDPSGVVTTVWQFMNGSSCPSGSNCIIRASRYVNDPGAPTSVSATAGNAQATVSWSAPSSNGGAAITSYTATASPGGATCTTSSTSCTITGLANGTSYTFTVKASNSEGTSAASSASAAVSPTAPAAAPAPAAPVPAATPAPLCTQTLYQQGKRTIAWNKTKKAYKVTSRIRIFEDAQRLCRTKLTVIYRNANTKVSLPQKSGSTLGYRKLRGKNFNAPVISWPTRKEMRFTTGDSTGENRKNARLVMVSYLKKSKAVPKNLKDIELVIVRRIPRNPAAAASPANPLFAQKSTFRSARGWAKVG
jgi:hypothetical protein